MTPTIQPTLTPVATLPVSTSAPSDEARLREALKRCPPETVEAACTFRQNGDLALLPVIVRGVIARYTDRVHRDRLNHADAVQLHLAADLGLDSLTMMEIVMLAEDVFPITINNDELRGLRTVGDVLHFIECKIRGVPPPTATVCTCTSVVQPDAAIAPGAPAADAPAPAPN